MNAFNLSSESHTPFTVEQRMIHRLLLHSSLLPDIGLLRGKMGLVIFFMHYHQSTHNEVYEDVATELMDGIIKEIHKELPVTFESGLSGIGWGIDYLIHQGFAEGNSEEVCEEIDRRIMEVDPRRMSDLSFETGLGGILCYVLGHLKMALDQNQKLPFDTLYLSDLYAACTHLTLHSDNVPRKTLELAEAYQCYYVNKSVPDDRIWELSILLQAIPDFDSKRMNTYSYGLEKGLAGTLLTNMIHP